MGTQRAKVLQLTKKLGVLRARDAESHGISRAVLARLVTAGELSRTARGTYVLPDADISEHHSLVLAATLVPNGVVCLLSALRFHELGTQAPYEVWLAIDNKAWTPRVESPALRIVRFSGSSLSEGIEEHVIEKVRVRIYGPAKTVVDCFRFRNKLGLDVALEALREFLRAHPRRRAELFKFAKLGRVANVMQPYLEALT